MAGEERQKAIKQAEVAIKAKREADEAAARAKKEKQEAENESIRRVAMGEFLIQDLLWQANTSLNQFEDQVTVLELLDKAAIKIDNSDRLKKSPKAEMDVRIAIGYTYFTLGRFLPARKHREVASEIAEQEFGLSYRSTIYALNVLSQCMLELRQLNEAERLINKEIKARQELNEETFDMVGYLRARQNMAWLLQERGLEVESEKLHREILAERIKEFGEDHLETYESYQEIGELLIQLERYKDAEPYIKKAFEGRTAHPELGPTNPLTNTSRHTMAITLKRQGRYEESCRLFHEVLDLTINVEGPDHPNTLRHRARLDLSTWK